MVARTLIVARKVWVSKEVSKPVKSKMGWIKSLVGWFTTLGLLTVAEQWDRRGISGLNGCCGEREWVAENDAEEEEEEEK